MRSMDVCLCVFLDCVEFFGNFPEIAWWAFKAAKRLMLNQSSLVCFL